MSTIGTRIARRRKELGMTQEGLAEKLGVSSQAVSKWENDVSCPDISLLPLLVKTLNMTSDELLTGKTSEVYVMPEAQRKPLDQLSLRIYVLSTDGNKVKVNLPMPLVKIGLELGIDLAPAYINGGKDVLKKIDLAKIMELAEQGALGKLVEVEAADGTTVEVVVE